MNDKLETIKQKLNKYCTHEMHTLLPDTDYLLGFLTEDDLAIYATCNEDTATRLLFERLLARQRDVSKGLTSIVDGTVKCSDKSSLLELDIMPITYIRCLLNGISRLGDLRDIDYGKLPGVCAMDLASAVSEKYGTCEVQYAGS